MIKNTVGAGRPATDDARLSRIAAANDLVQRTLAQHGLASLPEGSPSQTSAPGGFGMEDLLARFQTLGQMSPLSGTSPGITGMTAGSFACAAGKRDYRLYVPDSGREGVTGLVVMLHGCTQTPEDFAAGTGMNALADKHRFAVLYPQQSRGENAQSCWNWFSLGDQHRDRGEPEILAGMARQVAGAQGVPQGRTFVAGLSAGAAMAVILGATYPDVFSAVGAHSGLPLGAARDVASAFAAMAGNGPDAGALPGQAGAVRTIVFHGSADATVHPVNGDRIYRQVLESGSATTLHSSRKGTASGRSFERTTVAEPGRDPALEYWVVEGLGHAWSGGQPAGSYTDAKGPDASAEMVRFFFATDGGAA